MRTPHPEARSEERGAERRSLLPLLFVLLAPLALAQPLTVLTHDSFAVPEALIERFTDETGIEVEFLPGGDAGEVVSRAILTKDRPLADVLFGIDNSLLARAAREGIFEPYRSPLLDQVEERYRFDPQHLVTPVDVGFVNFNLDKAYFAETGLALPTDLAQLTEAAYRGLTAVPSPATSSPGLAFMLATIAKFGRSGEGDWLDFWAALRDNDLLVTSGWTDAYTAAFTRYGGDRPIVLSYASSPAAEVIFAETPLEEAPTANLFCEACVFEQIEGAGILKGTDQLEAAQRFIDFMLSPSFQAAIPESMFVYPVVLGVSLPEAFSKYGQAPGADERAALPYAEIEANLRTWLGQWSQVVEQGRDPEAVR